MTREEIIKEYETAVATHAAAAAAGIKGAKKSYELFKAGLNALRPVSRERVEKVWGVRAWETVADEGFVDTMGRQVFHLHCPVCDFFWRETGHKKYFRFCPHCGAPMTGEAAEMVMERLEALKGD